MGKQKKTKEEILLRRRLAERKKQERIKNDPVLYAQQKAKYKERYLRRKQEKKILPISEMTEKNRKKAQKRNRENFKAYYRRKKKENRLETIEEEVIIDVSEPDDNVKDPLHITPLSNKGTPYSLRSTDKEKPILREEWPIQRIITKAVIENNSTLSSISDTNLTQQSSNSTDCFAPLTLPTYRAESINSDTTVNSEQSSCIDTEDNNDTKQDSSSYATSTSGATVSSRNKIKRRVNSPSLVFKRYKYKVNKEMAIMRKKIEDLKKEKEKFRKQALRSVRLHSLSKRLRQKKKTPVVQNSLQDKTSKRALDDIKQDVKRYLELDENSRVCPGKREFISKKTIKKQKRYLCDTMLNLHQKFVETHSYRISYSTFCKLRPFWVVVPDSRARETCMCKTHTNMDLIIAALKRFNIINESSAHKVLSALCCDPQNTECLTRLCTRCVNQTITYKEFDNTKEIFYLHWTTQKTSYMKDGKQKTTMQTIKQKVTTYPKDVIGKFTSLLFPYMNHCANKISQNNYIRNLKANLPETDCMIQIDFSENYNTKYTEEIQSFHFGGSRQQITLHTSVIYFKKNSNLITQSFCTLSTSLRHDAVAVWSHLTPILNLIEREAPQVNAIHIVSDSPSGQYRNRKMFYIISKLNWQFPNLKVVAWNYTESGHGKSSADGVGATVKRTADRVVTQGHDIANIESLSEVLKSNLKKIKTEIVHEADIIQKDLLMATDLREFKGAMKVHQVVWNASKPYLLAMRKLSCASQDCLYQSIKCEHGKHSGFYTIPNEIPENKISNQDISKHQLTIPQTNREGVKLVVGEKTPKVFSSKLPNLPKKNVEISSEKPRILSNLLLKPASKINTARNIKTNKKSSIQPHATSKHSIIKYGVASSSLECQSKIKSIIKSDSKENENSSLNLSDNDSFWAPVSPVDLNITMPSFSMKKIDGTKKTFFSDSDSDLDIF